MIPKKLILLGLLVVSCKTSSRDDFGTQMTDVSVKVPDEFTSYDAKISFSRIDSSAKPKVVRGSDIKVKLPSGIYKIDLVLTDKAGTEMFRSCEAAKFYSLVNAKEDAIIDICRSSDRALVAKTIATNIEITPNPGTDHPDPGTNPGTNPGTGTTGTGTTGTGTGTGTGTKPGKDSGTQTDPLENETPLFFEESTCFGLPATYERQGNELVIKMTGSIKDHIYDATNAPKCTALFNIDKNVGQGFAPLNYKLKFETDEETLKQNNYLTVLIKDEEGIQALPCKTMLLSTTANSGAPYQCTFYDTSEEHRFTILERNKAPYERSCSTKSFQVRFEFFLNGKLDQRLKEMKLPELRVQIPLAETCIKPAS